MMEVGKLQITWKHFDRGGSTCDRCSDTRKNLGVVVEQLNSECGEETTVNLREIKLDELRIKESNELLFNGVPFEQLLSGVAVSKNSCGSCGKLIGKEIFCRTVSDTGNKYEAIPAGMIYEAACRLLSCCN